MILLDIVLIGGAALYGLIIGSFINAAEYRLFHRLPLGFYRKGVARSQCLHCEYQLRPMDLIPVVSYLILKGKCRSCQKRISQQYPLVEIATALLFAFIVWVVGWSAFTLFYLFFAAVLVFIFLYDLKYMLILDVVTVPAIFSVLIVHFLLGTDMIGLLIGGLVGGSFFAFQYIVSGGKWIGGGDIRLGVLLGVMLGWQLTVLMLFLSYVGGSIISVGLLVTKKVTMKTQIPFGVFLVPAGLISLLFGQRLLDWYFTLFL